MKTMKTLGLITVLLSITVIAGCSTGKTHGLWALHTPKVNSTQPRIETLTQPSAQTRTHTQNEQLATRSDINRRQDVAANANQSIPPESHSHTVQQTSHVKSPKSLITLSENDDLFELINESPGVVLVDFYADWCGPCKKQGAILHEMERSAAQSKASIIKVNVDQHQDLAQQFKVSSLPTLMLIKNDKIIQRQTGVADHQRVAAMLQK